MKKMAFTIRQEQNFACKTQHAIQYPCVYNAKYTLFVDIQTRSHLVRTRQMLLDREDHQAVLAQLVALGVSARPRATRQTLETT